MAFTVWSADGKRVVVLDAPPGRNRLFETPGELTEIKITHIRNLRAKGMIYREIAALTDCSISTVGSICRETV